MENELVRSISDINEIEKCQIGSVILGDIQTFWGCGQGCDVFGLVTIPLARKESQRFIMRKISESMVSVSQRNLSYDVYKLHKGGLSFQICSDQTLNYSSVLEKSSVNSPDGKWVFTFLEAYLPDDNFFYRIDKIAREFQYFLYRDKEFLERINRWRK